MQITRVHIIGNDPEDVLSRFPDDQSHIAVNWTRESERFGIEFGQIVLELKKDGTITINSENMSEDFVKRVLCAIVDKAKFIG